MKMLKHKNIATIISGSELTPLLRLLLMVYFSCGFFFSAQVMAEVSVTSVLVSDVGTRTVRLNANIGASQEPTRVSIKYGISSTNLTLSTAQKSLPASSISMSTSEFISGLQCETAYYYQVVANNGGVETRSGLGTFKTNSCVTIAAVITSQDATNVSQTSARLNGNISLDKNYVLVNYYFEYGFSTTYGESLTPSPIGQNSLQVTVDSDIFNLACGKTYHYRLVVNMKETLASDEVISVGNNVTFTTADCDPAEVLNLSVVSVGSDKATLQILLDTHGQEVDVYFQWGTLPDLTESTPVQKVSTATWIEQLSGLDCGIPYFFFAVVKGGGLDYTSDQLSFTTRACAQSPKAETLSAENITKGSATIRGNVTPNEATTSAYFEWGLLDSYNEITLAVSVVGSFAGEIVDTEITGLNCSTEYSYRVHAGNQNGQVQGQGLSFTTLACDSVEPGPGPIEGETSINVFSGQNHSLAMGKSGELISWGDNRFFQLGGTTDAPYLIDGVSASAPDPGQPALFFNLSDVAAGGDHSLILWEGFVLSFGNNNVGQLGASTNNAPARDPNFVTNESGAAISDVVEIDAGNKHSIALRSDGRVLLWGDNSFGQLAVESIPTSTQPLLLSAVSNVLKIAAGDNFNMALLQDRSLVSWGANGSGQLGIGGSSPRQEPSIVVGVSEVKEIAAGAEHVLVLKENGTALVWGNNLSGQLGIGNNENQASAVGLPILDTTVTGDIIKFAAGKNHSVALLDDGSMLAWGDNSFGQLGTITADNQNIPTKVMGLDGEPLTNIHSISAGANFTVAVTHNGNIIAWGDNSMGQLNGIPESVSHQEMLLDRSGTTISLNGPRLIADKTSLVIERGSVASLKLRLSSNPGSDTAVKAEFGDGAEGFFIERIIDNELTFATADDNWAFEKTLTISSVATSNIDQATLKLSAPGFTSLEIAVEIDTGLSQKPRKQVVGSFSPIIVGIFLLLLFYSCARCSKRLT